MSSRKPYAVTPTRQMTENNLIRSIGFYIGDLPSGSPALYVGGETGFEAVRPMRIRALRARCLDTGATSGDASTFTLRNVTKSAIAYVVTLTSDGTSPTWIAGEDTSENNDHASEFDVGDYWRVEPTTDDATNMIYHQFEIELEEYVPYIKRAKEA